MTYEEIQSRLTKCQTALETLNNVHAGGSIPAAQAATIQQLHTLEESLKNKLKIIKEEESGTIFTDDEGEALDLSKKGANVKLTKENERLVKNKGVEFDLTATKQLAKLTGKAVIIALKKAGDAIQSIKAIGIEPMSFEIDVDYKDNNHGDEFSFHVQNNKLVLADFSFTKPLVEVGVKPSGEPILNVDVLANELLKHFQALSEQEGGLNEADNYYIEVSVRTAKVALEVLHDSFRNQFETNGSNYYIFKDEETAIGAQEALEFAKVEIEDHNLEEGERLQEGPHQTTYIKIATSDYKKAMSILDDNIDPTYVKMDIVDDDGDGNVIIYFNFRHEDGFDDMYDDSENKDSEFYQEPEEDPAAFIYDVAMDLRANDIPVTGSSHDIDEAVDNSDWAMKIRGINQHGRNMKQVDKLKKSSPSINPDYKKGSSLSPKKRELLYRLQAKRRQVMRDMEQEAEPTGGPIADKYGDILNKIDNAIEKASGQKQMSYDDAIKEGRGDLDTIVRVITDMAAEDGTTTKEAALEVIEAIRDAYMIDAYDEGVIKENLNPEVSKKVNQFIKAMAKRYGYDEQDAVFAIKQALRLRGMGKEDAAELDENKILKEFTDNSFKGSELIDKVNSQSPDMFGKGVFADLLPKGVASENDAFEALKKHDKSGIKARMGQYAPMFVHVQYHNLEHEGEDYRMHQTQYYNSNFKDKDPDFNPGVSKITLFKITKKAADRRDKEESDNLGTILVKTSEYVQDLNVLPGLGKRVSEEVNEGDSNITSFLLKYRDASVKHIEGRLEDDMGTQEVAIEYLDWSEEEASDADGTVYADAAETIADNPELAQEFLDQDDMKQIKMASGVNESSCKVGDILTKDGKKGKVVSVSGTQITVDFGNGDVYGIAHSRIKDGKILKEATRQDLGMSSSVSKRRAKAELKKPGNDGSKVYGLDKDGKRVHIKSINDVDRFKKFELDADLNENKVADKDIEKEIKSLQKENPKGYAAEIKKLKVRLAAINLSKKKVINEKAKKAINEYGSSDIDELVGAIGYRALEHFFEDNPGAHQALDEWLRTVPEFVSKIEDQFEDDYSPSMDRMLDAIGYDDFDQFFDDNPGGVEIIADWIISIPEFVKKLANEYTTDELENFGLYDVDGYDAEDEDIEEAELPKKFNSGKYSVAKLQKAHDVITGVMKDLGKKYYEGDKSVVSQLKDLTKQKKHIESLLDAKVGQTYKNMDITTEAGPGFAHDCAAKVVHEAYGKGTCVPEKHTLVKEGKKYVVTHYDVLFENGKTVENIPVKELDIKTTNEHWHKGYKKKKK
tara:strand:- start:28821 stop:32711 length:3891 start_codon:yes stop_codon:yes gene_type:complete